MSKEFEKLNKKIIRQFGKDRCMALATCNNDVPTVRIIDAYYFNSSFYIVTYESSEKVQQILKNRNVSLCAALHEFQGEAFNIGHPLKEENKEIRDILTVAFSNWYFAHNDESDPKMCFVQVKINTGFTHFNKVGYNVDFRTEEVVSFPFDVKV
ncbi:MAG: pyridoxamine 5'-phosphate oxidase family protein [Spirochaetaceae bacterium]